MAGEEDRHVCCVFDSSDAFISAAVAFLRPGLHRERLLYIADRPSRAHLLDDLVELGDAELLTDEGDLMVATASETYLHDEAVDPAAQVDDYRKLVDAALADGFQGLRVAADATPLVVRADRRRAFMSYEIAVDQFMRTAPMRAMCGYDAGVLNSAALDLACLHRHTVAGGHRFEPGFRLLPSDTATVSVAGEVDVSNASHFATALDAAAGALALLPDAGDDEVVLDARGLSFIDSEGATALLTFAEHIGPDRTVVVKEPPRSLCAVVDSLGWGDRIRYRWEATR